MPKSEAFSFEEGLSNSGDETTAVTWCTSLCYESCSLGGSLQDVLLAKSKTADYFKESELKEILLQVSMGLKYIHTSGLVHMDIKPSKALYLCLSLPLPILCAE